MRWILTMLLCVALPATGISSGAMRFDGVDDYVDLDAHISDFSSLSEGAISVWFKTYSGLTRSILSSADEAEINSDLLLWLGADDKIKFRTRENAIQSLSLSTDSTYSDNQWHHVVFSVDSSGNTLYVDGSSATVT